MLKPVSRVGISLLLGSAASLVSAAVLTVTDSTYGAADGSSLTRTLAILSPGTITDVNITVDFAKCTGTTAVQPGETLCLDQTNGAFVGEIFAFLVSPFGTRVDLVYTYSGIAEGISAGSNEVAGTYSTNISGRRVQVVFDDAAASGVGPFMQTGSFRPEESLGSFTGEGALGDWKLTIGDSFVLDPLSYFSARLDITTREGNGGGDLPEPASLALTGLALFGLAATRRRWAKKS